MLELLTRIFHAPRILIEESMVMPPDGICQDCKCPAPFDDNVCEDCAIITRL